MQLIRVLAALAVVGSVACTKSETIECGEYTCSKLQVCAPSGDHCVLQTQLDACQGKGAGDGCSFAGTPQGVCDGTAVCVATGCGNGIVESGELCDDGNRVSLDGCSADCKSKETCGDGVTDLAKGELCDCGSTVGAPPAGCTGVNSMESGATCRLDCHPARCGDTVVDPNELCDDGNIDPGDGCRADCEGRWTQASSNTFASLFAVHARSKDDAWAGGFQRLVHWDGAHWTIVPLMTAYASFKVVDLYAPAADELFVIVRSTTLGPPETHLLHYVNATWSDVTPAPPQPAYTLVWLAMAGSGSSVVAVADETATASGTYVARWTGATFTVEGVGGAASPPKSIALRSGSPYIVDGNRHIFARGATTWAQYGSTTADAIASSGADLFAFQNLADAHYAPAGSSTFVTVTGSFDIADVRRVAAAANTAIAVSVRGAVLVCSLSSTPTCSASLTRTTADLSGVSVVDDKHAFIVGEAGTVLY